MKKILLTSVLLGAALLLSRESAALTPSPEQLLEDLNMLGIRMVYQPQPLNIKNANALLEQAEEKIEMLEQIGSKKQIKKAKENLAGMLNMYKIHLERPERKKDYSGPPPVLLAPRPAQINE